ncbi:MAG: hypothetical protein KG028_10420 [Actinobacteria bacterium]|jgi:hypothetical protein|nr:hypothetical protein [Actinomycetota bacterium]
MNVRVRLQTELGDWIVGDTAELSQSELVKLRFDLSYLLTQPTQEFKLLTGVSTTIVAGRRLIQAVIDTEPPDTAVDDARALARLVNAAALLLLAGDDPTRLARQLLASMEGEHRFVDEAGNAVEVWPETDLEAFTDELEQRLHQLTPPVSDAPVADDMRAAPGDRAANGDPEDAAGRVERGPSEEEEADE